MLLISLNVNGQELNVTHYDLSSVFPSSSLYALHQDNRGNLWIANGVGVCRYDGYDFVSFTQKDGIPGFNVLKFFPQNNSSIWGTCFDHSLFYFSGNSNKFHAYIFNDTIKSYLGPKAEIKSVFVDKAGTLHLGGCSIPPAFKIDRTGKVTYDNDENISEINYLCLKDDFFFVSSHLSSTVEKSTFI